MKVIYRLNGKVVSKKELKDAKLVKKVRVSEDHYETAEYFQQQAINAANYFKEAREQREDLEARHG